MPERSHTLKVASAEGRVENSPAPRRNKSPAPALSPPVIYQLSLQAAVVFAGVFLVLDRSARFDETDSRRRCTKISAVSRGRSIPANEILCFLAACSTPSRWVNSPHFSTPAHCVAHRLRTRAAFCWRIPGSARAEILCLLAAEPLLDAAFSLRAESFARNHPGLLVDSPDCFGSAIPYLLRDQINWSQRTCFAGVSCTSSR